MADKPTKVPYRNLQDDVEVEMVSVDDDHRRGRQSIDLDSPPPPSSSSRTGNEVRSELSPLAVPNRPQNNSLVMLILSCTVAAGVQFGWALQLSLLTPYIQTLGIGHAFSSFIWLCGPITGLVVQPCVGIWSDKCTSKYGRRRPFIFAGSIMISFAVILIGFSADIGYVLGDTREHCSTFKGTRLRAAVVFIIGFWLLDLANNTVQVKIFSMGSAPFIFLYELQHLFFEGLILFLSNLHCFDVIKTFVLSPPSIPYLLYTSDSVFCCGNSTVTESA
ncbi:hypothetical protein SAY87_018062 [Trapa incisa]|uniref:Sucrose transporter n=1 Tax=Trapa incisa TaxID=236973 RepID=A0AAN7QVW7_9MYRT|nr:hypothetical protein SAY87_018062 [Trapa incisa]